MRLQYVVDLSEWFCPCRGGQGCFAACLPCGFHKILGNRNHSLERSALDRRSAPDALTVAAIAHQAPFTGHVKLLGLKKAQLK